MFQGIGGVVRSYECDIRDSLGVLNHFSQENNISAKLENDLFIRMNSLRVYTPKIHVLTTQD